jgi:regulatory protein RepA
MDNQIDLLKMLEYIHPANLSYQEWVNIGMALKHEGYSVSDWDSWSRGDSGRYHVGDCEKKWNSFKGTSSPVTAGTIVQMAKENGWQPTSRHYSLDWDAEISDNDEMVVVQKGWLEGREIKEVEKWDPVRQLVTYLETLFEASENVGYVTECWEKDGKYLPKKGSCDRTAGQLIQLLEQSNGDICSVVGDYTEQAGAWIRFNALDGKGVKNENVTDFRYALVESDAMDIEQQNAIIRELELPVACLVHSGGKSLHAICKIDATNYEEYRKRVDYLYTVCQKNGFKVDSQNRNPSRLSRMPGIIRNGNKQFLVDTNIGKDNWKEWQDWIESVNDDLPDPENMEGIWDNIPDLSPPLIHGILRQGHKMLLAGPSKAGKSYSLIQLTCAIAEGKQWMGFECARGRIMYVNLELDRASCLHRFKDVYTSLGWKPEHISNIDIWNLRGKSVPMDKLAPKLIRRAAKKNYIAIIIDPIYKVITGDENSADQMAKFCNQFDIVCHELNAAVIYCHHHSKGGQGNKKSMDRASGSGVFARDPDALLDLIELELNEDILKQETNKALCKLCERWLETHVPTWRDEVSMDDLCSHNAMLQHCTKLLLPQVYQNMQKELFICEKATQHLTAWKIEGTLREFPRFPPVRCWFNYPTHKVDNDGSLKDLDTEGTEKGGYGKTWKKNFKKKSEADLKKERIDSLDLAINGSFEDIPLLKTVSEFMGISEKSVRNRIKESGKYEIVRGEIRTI